MRQADLRRSNKEIGLGSRIDATDSIPAFEDSSWTVLEGFRGLFWLG